MAVVIEEPHFTYSPQHARPDLQQGDLLAKTPEIVAVLELVHPHYRKDDYTHFIILTQSCDLVRRGATPCKSRYISIAAVRPLSLVLRRQLNSLRGTFELEADVCRVSRRDRIKQFLERLFNNNEPEYFYLEPEPAFGLSEPSCAFLRLAVALRAAEHYDKCLAARLLSLTDVFQAKLGWLVGNMYSRVGTEDWIPKIATQAAFVAKIEHHLTGLTTWVDDERLDAAQRTRPEGVSGTALREHVQSIVVRSRKEQVIDRAIEVLVEVGVLNRTDALKARSALTNDPTVSAQLKSPKR
jgi:hypothetical protein